MIREEFYSKNAKLELSTASIKKNNKYVSRIRLVFTPALTDKEKAVLKNQNIRWSDKARYNYQRNILVQINTSEIGYILPALQAYATDFKSGWDRYITQLAKMNRFIVKDNALHFFHKSNTGEKKDIFIGLMPNSDTLYIRVDSFKGETRTSISFPLVEYYKFLLALTEANKECIKIEDIKYDNTQKKEQVNNIENKPKTEIKEPNDETLEIDMLTFDNN
jgi:hypothetical protein